MICNSLISKNFNFKNVKLLSSLLSNGSIFWLIAKNGLKLDKKNPPGTNTKSQLFLLKYEYEKKSVKVKKENYSNNLFVIHFTEKFFEKDELTILFETITKVISKIFNCCFNKF